MKHHLTALGEIKNLLSRGEVLDYSYTSIYPRVLTLAQLNLDAQQDVAADELAQLVHQRVAAQSSSAESAWWKTHPKWREFKQRVWAVHHPDEALPDDEHNEVIVQLHAHSSETNYLCPITRALLVHPVKKYGPAGVGDCAY